MSIQTPDVLLKKVFPVIVGNIRVTFLSTVLFGLITHLFVLTNSLPNWDEVISLVGNIEWSTNINGRWFLPYIAAISSIFSMPWVNGLLSIIYLSISACLVVTITKVKEPVFCALISGLMVTFPTVAGIFSVMQAADPYIFGLMLACFAVFLAQRYKYGYIIATIPILLSLAIYQAFFSVVVALLILILILDVLDNQTTWQKMLYKGIRFVGTLVAGIIMYFISVKIVYPDGLADHQGLDQMGQTSLYEFFIGILRAYNSIARFFILDSRNFHYSFMNIIFVIAFIACGILIVLCAKKKQLHKEPLKLVLLFVLIILFPIGCNFIYLMGVSVEHELTIYATVFILIFLLVIADMHINMQSEENIQTGDKKATFAKTQRISAWIITSAMVLTMFNYWIMSNQVYFKLNIGYQTAYAQSILLVSRIQSIEGYTYDKDIVIVGSARIPEGIPELREITMFGVTGPELFGCFSYAYFLRNYLNFTQNVEHMRFYHTLVGMVSGDKEIIKAMYITRNMPVYPDSGSIVIVDDTIYVRFAYIYECCWEFNCSCTEENRYRRFP